MGAKGFVIFAVQSSWPEAVNEINKRGNKSNFIPHFIGHNAGLGLAYFIFEQIVSI